jgi:hypothetical protein
MYARKMAEGVTKAHLKPLFSGQVSLSRRQQARKPGGQTIIEGFAPEVALQRIAKIQYNNQMECQRCHDLVPKKLKAEFCTGVSGRVCGREIERGNQCTKCYNKPEAMKMRKEKKAARPKCRIDGCGGNEFRSYGLRDKHYRKRNNDAKAEMKVATDGNFGN